MPLHLLRRTFLLTAALAVVAQAFAADEKSDDKKPQEVKVEGITLMIPADWKQQPPANRLRAAQFVVPAASEGEEPTEMVVSFFGGTGGGSSANIERWVGQFDSEGRMAKTTKGQSKLGPYYFVDVSGTYKMSVGPPILQQTKEVPDARMLGIILEAEGKGNYFLKLAGPEKTVSAQEEALRASIGGDKKTEKPVE